MKQTGFRSFAVIFAILCLTASVQAETVCQNKTPLQSLKMEIRKYLPFIESAPVTRKQKDKATFHLNRFLQNKDIIADINPGFARDFAEHKLNHLKYFKSASFNARNFFDAYFGSFNIGILGTQKIIRNSQPSERDLLWMIDNIGLKTVINLRTERNYWDGFSADDEERICREKGLVYRNFRLRDWNDPPPSPEAINEVLDFIDSCPKPVLFHCAYGKGRTGMVAMGYRITRQGWTSDRAIKEAMHYGFKPDQVPNQVKVMREMEKKWKKAKR